MPLSVNSCHASQFTYPISNESHAPRGSLRKRPFNSDWSLTAASVMFTKNGTSSSALMTVWALTRLSSAHLLHRGQYL